MKLKVIPVLSITMLAATLNGCSGVPAIVKAGDKVELGFTCRLPDGKLAATTKPDSYFSDEMKSPFYLPRSGAETVVLLAGPQAADPKQERFPFEDEIMKRLAVTLPGLKEGDLAVRDLQAGRYPALSLKDRHVHMAKVRKRRKEMRLSLEEYSNRTGKSPEVGQRLIIDPLLPGRVSEVTDKEVVIQFAPEPGKPLTTPFGTVTLHETPDQYELEIDAKIGQLVRSGGMAGRISSVDENSFEVDFGHPFGGENLHCNLEVSSVKPADKNDVAPVANGGNVTKTENAHVSAGEGKLDPKAEKAFDKGLSNLNSNTARKAFQ